MIFLIKEIHSYFLPIELNFVGFKPIHRFFELNPKKRIYRVNIKEELTILYKIILINFFDVFNLEPKSNEEIATQFFRKKIKIKETMLLNPNQFNEDNNINSLKGVLFNNYNKPLIHNPMKKEKPMIVLDASNIAMRHGNNSFSSKGIQIVMNIFTKQGHRVISFLPEYLFRQKDPNKKIGKERVVPDDLNYLKKLVDQHLVIQSPPQDYDDSYAIQYAKKHNAYIVTNDLFRDYLEHISEDKLRETEKMWVKEKCISFTFNIDEFLPNPDAAFFKEFNIKNYNN